MPGRTLKRAPTALGRKSHDLATGFTLIELIVVLVITGLLLGLILAYGPLRSPNLQIRGAASEVAQGLRVARARAIALNRPVSFLLDPTGHVYRIDNATPRLLPKDIQLAMLTAAGKSGPAQGVRSISFAPDGSSSGGRIALAENGLRLLVGVDWLTGRVTVADGR
jgi:general secretion pathway protein H